MVTETAQSFFKGSGINPFPFGCKIRGDVPQARGLGSSVTVRLGILMALNELSGKPLSRSGMFRLCADLEGHPDNAAPALFGGFTIARELRDPVRYTVAPGLCFVLIVPDFEVSTPEARKVMPRSIGITEAAANAADAAVIAAAFATKRYELLRGSFGDRLHQPHRAKLVPFLDEVVEAGDRAGALGGWLSGSGSTICSLAPSRAAAKKIALALKNKAPAGAKIILCEADNRGARRVVAAGS
jgi:homoserine kinase